MLCYSSQLFFFSDFDINLGKYTSVMMEKRITLRKASLNYYYNLTLIYTDINLELDITQSFPFTVFQSF